MNRNSTHEGRGPSSNSGCVVSAAAAGEVVVSNSSASLSRGQMPSPVRLLRHGPRTIISFIFRLVIVADSCKTYNPRTGRALGREKGSFARRMSSRGICRALCTQGAQSVFAKYSKSFSLSDCISVGASPNLGSHPRVADSSWMAQPRWLALHCC